MSKSMRAHLNDSFQRHLHPEITEDGDALTVKIEARRLRLPHNKIAEVQRQHPCCSFDSKHLVMKGEREHLCECIRFIAESEEKTPMDSLLGCHDGRRRVPRSASVR